MLWAVGDKRVAADAKEDEVVFLWKNESLECIKLHFPYLLALITELRINSFRTIDSDFSDIVSRITSTTAIIIVAIIVIIIIIIRMITVQRELDRECTNVRLVYQLCCKQPHSCRLIYWKIDNTLRVGNRNKGDHFPSSNSTNSSLRGILLLNKAGEDDRDSGSGPASGLDWMSLAGWCDPTINSDLSSQSAPKRESAVRILLWWK